MMKMIKKMKTIKTMKNMKMMKTNQEREEGPLIWRRVSIRRLETFCSMKLHLSRGDLFLGPSPGVGLSADIGAVHV